MSNRGLLIYRIIVKVFIAGGLLLGSQVVFAQESTKNAAPAVTVSGAGSAASTDPSDYTLAHNIKKGLDLFEGTVRLKNGGAPCNVCHHVESEAVIGGGVLARDLTTVFSRMGGEGVVAMLPRNGMESPFPVMQAAFQGKPITEDEVLALASFLQNADKQSAFQKPAQYSLKLFAGAAAGVVVMLIFFQLVGKRRKKRSVNSDIYDRQLKSEDV